MSNQNNQNNLLARWLEGDLTTEERKEIENSKDFAAYTEILKGTEKFRTTSFNVEEEFLKQKEFNANYAKQKSKVIKFRPWVYLAAACAAILMLFTIGGNLFSSSEIHISTAMAENKEHVLPDHSVITLNAESSISYNKDSFNKTRKLSLTGQAFFKVAKGSKFSVNTNNGTISVLGTQFDVFSRNNKLNVRCFEGKVQVQNNTKSVILTKGKAVKNNRDNQLLPFTITAKTPEWTQGNSAFTEASLEDVISELERQYNIKINSKNINTKRTFTGFFTHKHLKNALKTCFTPLNINYTFVNANEIVLKE